MLPQSHDLPSHTSKPPKVPAVSLPIEAYFGLPELRHRMFPQRKAESMPEVTINKDSDHRGSEYDVRRAGKGPYVLSKTKSPPMQQTSDATLKVGITVLYPRHT